MASALPVTFAECGPIFVLSTLSAHARDCRAACFRRPISFFSCAFCASSNASCRCLFSYHEEKLPFCTSMPPRLMDRMWSTQPSKNARSCETSRKPDFLARYRLTSARPVSSRWFVGSSMSRYRPSRAKSSASRIFACSPPESVENGRYSASSVTNSGASSRRRRHCGTSGKLHSSSSSGVSAASGMGYGKYSNPPGAVIVPWWGYWPCRRRRSVVLPRPLRPVRPSRQSVSSWKLTCSNTGSKLPGYVKVRSVIWINAIGMPSFRQPRIPSTIAGDRIGANKKIGCGKRSHSRRAFCACRKMGRRSARRLRDKADFPRKGTTNQTVFTASVLRSCQVFSRRSCACSQTPFCSL